MGFAGPYDFDVLAAYRPIGRSPVERQALLVRPHVLAGRAFSCVEERQLRHLGKDCLVAFDGNLYSVPARSAPAG
ncbi:Mu transposase domain-containing protein [Streptomyces sp. 900105755]